MQAHVLQLPEAYGGGGGVVVRSSIEKAIVDVESQNAALMLADSSCLLVSLTTSSPCSVTPVSIPAPCTDACFLRLRTSSSGKAIHMPSVTANNPNRLAPHVSTHLQSSASHPGSSITGRSNAHNIQTLTHRRLAAAAETKLYMLTTQPTGDGTCMEFRAWSCDARAFSPVTVEVGSEQIVVGSTGRVAARLEAPYGLDVKIGASINVVVVYSSSAGKIWIMAAKSASGKGSSSGGSHAAAKGATALEGEGTARADDREGEGATTRLLLLNSVVLDCNRPVFSLHVSPQHLLLGENNGVRVWFLRPLIKPSKMEKDKAQVKLIKPKLKAHEEVGGFLIKRSPQNGFKWEVKLQNGGHPRVSAAEVESAVVAMTGDGRIKGSKVKDEDMQEKPEEGGGNFLEKERINGVVQINSVGGRGNIPAPFPGDLERDLESSVDSQGDAVSNDNFVLLHLQGTGGRNGSVPVVGAPVKHQEPVNQPTQKVSLMETASVPCPSSVLLLNGKGGTAMKRVGLAGPLFVRINEDDDIDLSVTKRRSQGAPPPTQVVDIQALNLKKFVLLDSRGTLNLLTLQESPEGQEPGTLNRFQLLTKHLQSSICVSSMAVLPPPPAIVSNGAPLGRKLWISDGKYSVHVVILSDDGTLAANVTQAVFTNERIKGLFAGSAKTVMVLTEGVVYSPYFGFSSYGQLLVDITNICFSIQYMGLPCSPNAVLDGAAVCQPISSGSLRRVCPLQEAWSCMWKLGANCVSDLLNPAALLYDGRAQSYCGVTTDCKAFLLFDG